MSDIIPLLFEGEHLVRTVDRNGEPWFVAADVCRVLDIANARDALAKLDGDEVSTVALTDGAPGGPPRNIVNESGLYTLVLRCRDATTPGTVPHRFRRWVTAEVLPALRRTGSYAAPRGEAGNAAPGRSFPDWPLDELRTKRNVIETSRMLHGIAGARWMAEQLGFPTPPAGSHPDAAAPRRSPVEAWWQGRLAAGLTRRTAVAWEVQVAIDDLFADYCLEIGEGGPPAEMLRPAWATRLHRLVPTIRTMRVRAADPTGSRRRMYLLPSLADARALFCAATGEVPAWSAGEASVI